MSKLIQSQKPTVGLRFPQAMNELKLGVLLTEFGSTKDMHKILTFICALFNSGGGTLTLFVDGHYTVSAFENLVRGIEQQILSMIPVYMASHVEITNYDNHRLVITINTCYEPVVLKWNLFLPVNSQVKALPPYEPIGNIRHVSIENVTVNGSHLKSFTIDKKIDVHKSKTVQLKYLEQMKSEHTSLADRMVSNFTKFSTYVSAFANFYGGHIYYGITDDGIVKGQLIPEFEKDEVHGKIQKAINKMLWPKGINYKPKRGIHWDVYFEPVKDGNGDVIPSVVVPVVFIAHCPGGVFTQKTESYHLVNGHVMQMSYRDILERLGVSLWFSPESDLQFERSRFLFHAMILRDYHLLEQQAYSDSDKSYSEYAKFDAPDSELSEMLDYCDQHPVERAFLSQEKPDLSNDCAAYLQGLDWVKDFRMVEANDEYSTRHLEIVCKFGSVPRIPDIAKHFGDDVLPFVNYEAEKDVGTFEMPEYYYQRQFARAFFSQEKQGLPDDCIKYLQGLDWIKDFNIVEANGECRARHLEIVCKFGSVPRIADIVQHFGEGVLSFVTYKAEKEPNVEQDSKVDEKNIPVNSDHETDEELESDFDEHESESDDEETDEELESDFDEQEGESDHEEDVSRSAWFKRTVLNGNYEVRKKYKEALRGLGWVKACAVGVPNEENDELYLLLVCKKGKVPRMAQLKKRLGKKIVSYVEFMAEITFKLEMNNCEHGPSSHGESFNSESSHGELSVAPKQCRAMSVMPGDGIYLENEGPDLYGTIGFFVRINQYENRLFLATCYHVCYSGEKLPKDTGKAHQILDADSKDKKSLTRAASFWTLPRRERKDEQSQNGVDGRNEGKVAEEKKGTEECEESKINGQDCSNGVQEGLEEGQGQIAKKAEGETKELERKEVKLGPFFWGDYDTGHDIGFVELGPNDATCVCSSSADHLKKEISRKNKIKTDIMERGYRVVQKTGYSTGTRKGRVRFISYCDLGTTAETNLGLVIGDEDPKLPFASPGDSGSLVSLIKDGEEIPIAHLAIAGTTEENEGSETAVHFCHFLIEIMRKCRRTEEVGELQLYLNGCVCSGAYLEEKEEKSKSKRKEGTKVKCQNRRKKPKS